MQTLLAVIGGIAIAFVVILMVSTAVGGKKINCTITPSAEYSVSE